MARIDSINFPDTLKPVACFSQMQLGKLGYPKLRIRNILPRNLARDVSWVRRQKCLHTSVLQHHRASNTSENL